MINSFGYLYGNIGSIKKGVVTDFVFDIDGVLIKGGLEVGTNKEFKLEDYIRDKDETILKFKSNIKDIIDNGDNVVICTGRGNDFGKRVGDGILGGNYTKIISEGGILIDDGLKSRTFGLLDKNIEYLVNLKSDLQDFVYSIGGTFEEGKKYNLSFNPPKGISILDFKEQIINGFFLERKLNYIDFLYVTNSDTAVDILPNGTDKNITLNHELNSDNRVYFGDASNDFTAISDSSFGVVPRNASKNFLDSIIDNNVDFTYFQRRNIMNK